MINANKDKLLSFFQGSSQFVVPFFQRAYVWDEENWGTMWDHVSSVLDSCAGNLSKEHFIGTIITKQRPDFDSRNYGYAKLSDLMAATTLFDLERRAPGDGKAAVIYARDNRRRTQA